MKSEPLFGDSLKEESIAEKVIVMVFASELQDSFFKSYARKAAKLVNFSTCHPLLPELSLDFTIRPTFLCQRKTEGNLDLESRRLDGTMTILDELG